VHTAFSRDNRGLNYDRYFKDLIEKETAPRYIDSVIVEQGATVCDMVMSKKQGGLGGYLYVCGSLSVFGKFDAIWTKITTIRMFEE
jgi:hypothetical protein